MSLLLLFDIDGTLLIGAADAHRDAMRAALLEVYGIDPDRIRVDPAGRTDLEIARMILVDCDVDAKRIDDGLADLHVAMVRAYAERAHDLSDRVAPGAREVLERLAGGEDILSLVTGNLEPIARLKLRCGGIGRYFAHGQGGFGSDAEDRTYLPGIARRRAGDSGHPWPAERTVVIGDTPRDIVCARADGVRCIGVPTGPHAAADLRDADAVVGSLTELPDALDAWR